MKRKNSSIVLSVNANLPRGGAQPYQRRSRPSPDPTPPEVAEALKNCADLGACGRALKATFPNWTEAQLIQALREYLRNLQYRWGASPERKAREALARRDQGERLAEALADATVEIAALRGDKVELEEQLSELEDEIDGLRQRSAPGR